MRQRFQTFAEFYPFYLNEHSNRVCRNLHYLGSTLVLILLFYSLLTGSYKFLFLLPVVGYGCAWVGHFFFEKSRPASFKYPLYSFIGDRVMFKDFVISLFQYKKEKL